VGDSAAAAQGYQLLGEAHWCLARMAEAGHAFAQAAHFAREVGDQAMEASSLEFQAATGMFSGMPAQPLLALNQRAYDIAQAAGDKRRMSSVANKLGYGRLAHGMGDFDRIEQEFRHGLLLSREIGARADEESIFANLCVLFTAKGEYRQALEAYHTSIEVGQARRLWRYWIARHYLGALRMQMGDLAAARAELTQASEQLRRLGSRHFEVKARCDLGLLYHLAGEHGLARAELTQVLDLIQGYGDLRFEALVSTRLGYALEASQTPHDAQPLYARGQWLHEQMGQYYYALNARAGLARLAAQQGNDTAALEHVRTIWETLRGRSTDATVETARTLRTCYTLFRRHDDPRATEILNTAHVQLRRRAATIDDPQTVTLFWQLSDHRFFQEAAARGG
jgi:tetratricopeptide (TPR) repeat protein